jgi:hypothetical protein
MCGLGGVCTYDGSTTDPPQLSRQARQHLRMRGGGVDIGHACERPVRLAVTSMVVAPKTASGASMAAAVHNSGPPRFVCNWTPGNVSPATARYSFG